jgi:hypothetical protein
MSTTTIKFFAFAHLPAHLQAVSKPIGELANLFEEQIPSGPEKSAGMRKLLEAKDCFVRAALEAPKPITVETKTYTDGTSATGTAPLPDVSPTGAPALQPHQQRIVDEAAELDSKSVKLLAFFDTPTFAGLDEDEQSRLRQQYHAMACYSAILGERIAAFAPAADEARLQQHADMVRESGWKANYGDGQQNAAWAPNLKPGDGTPV